MPRIDLIRRVINIVILLVAILLSQNEPVAQHNSVLTVQRYYDEVMDSDNQNRFRTCCRMDKETFLKLLLLLTGHGCLRDGR